MKKQDSHVPTRTISAIAREVGVAAETIRDYERRGIIAPTRDSTGRRLFSEADIEAARAYREGRGHKYPRAAA